MTMHIVYSAQVSFYDENRMYNKDFFQLSVDDENKVEECVKFLFMREHPKKQYQIHRITINPIKVHDFKFKKQTILVS